MTEHGIIEAGEDPGVEEAEVVAAREDELGEGERWASGAKCHDGRASGEISLPFFGRKNHYGMVTRGRKHGVWMDNY